MKVFGLDFTSAPRKRKPITCVTTIVKDNALHYKLLEHFTDFAQFEAFLQREGPWTAGFDFPFGQPRLLIENLEWPQTWAGYVAHVSTMSMTQLEEVFRRYRNSRPPGDKHHYRRGDKLAGALSPMMLYRIPIGRMFFRGAPRLLQAEVSVVPCRPLLGANRTAVEAYPALVARKWLDGESYKSDTKSKQTPEQRQNRQKLVRALQSEACAEIYGFRVRLEEQHAKALIADPSGDDLDALLCAVQAAWASTQVNFGVPPECDPLEGWIVDPETVSF